MEVDIHQILPIFKIKNSQIKYQNIKIYKIIIKINSNNLFIKNKSK